MGLFEFTDCWFSVWFGEELIADVLTELDWPPDSFTEIIFSVLSNFWGLLWLPYDD